MPEPKIAVTFNVEHLADFALKEAAKNAFFKNKPIFAKCVFDEGEYFLGIEVSTHPDDEN